MHFRLLLPLLAALLPLGAAATDKPLPPANAIGNVWSLSLQPCNGGGGNAYTQYPDAEQVRATKTLRLAEIGYEFDVPQVPGVETTVVKIRLGDHSRGVTDHYLLLSDQDLEAPFGAIVVTLLPQGMQTREAAFAAVRTLQQGLARDISLAPVLEPLADGPFGPALELLVPDRVGTHCFPTSSFALVPAGVPVRTMGISRFVFSNGNLVEFALVVRIPEGMTDDDAKPYARSVMDGFWRSLKPL